jgi:parallel beta-helix repeat protein
MINMNMAMQKLFTAAIIAIALATILLTHTTAGLLSTTQTIPSNGTITAPVLSLTIGSSSNPAKAASPILISGQIATAGNYSNLSIDIQYSQDQSTWHNISTVTTNSDGTFETAFAFPSSGTYFVRATCGDQVNFYSQLVVDRFVNLNGSEDSVDIQTAIDSLPSTGGIVYIRSGLYDLEGNSLVLRSDLTLIGDGIDRTIVRLFPTMHDESMGVADAITSETDITNLLVENFTVVQNVVRLNHHGGIVLRGSANNNIAVRNMKITDVSGPGIGLGTYNNLLIENCIVERAWTGINLYGGENALIRGNVVINTAGDGIYPQVHASNVIIENNYLENIGDTAVDVCGFASWGSLSEKHIVVRNNTIKNGPIRVTNAIDVQVINNRIQYGEINVDGGQGTPVDVKIIGNQIVSTGRAAIAFYGAANSSAENNIIRMEPPSPNVTQSGIIAAIWGTGRIINNTILNSANYGIDFGGWALGSGNNITIMNNTIQDFGNFGIYDDNKHQETVYVENNTFIYNAKATAIFVEDPANHWIITGNILVKH